MFEEWKSVFDFNILASSLTAIVGLTGGLVVSSAIASVVSGTYHDKNNLEEYCDDTTFSEFSNFDQEREL